MKTLDIVLITILAIMFIFGIIKGINDDFKS